MYANRCGSQSGPTAAGRLYSRRATNLTPYFPDLAPVLAARLPDDLVLDGEIVAWDTTAGRLDFASLQNRMTAGRRLRAVVERRPAQFVAFDVLAADGKDLRPKALRDRRRVLERALSGLASPIVLCQQTTDAAVAEEWMSTLTAGGVEGLVIKDASSTYPARDGQRVWWKRRVPRARSRRRRRGPRRSPARDARRAARSRGDLGRAVRPQVKAKATLDMIAIGCTGTVAAPNTLVLAFPGDVDDDGQLRTAGSTTVLTRAAARAVAPLLHPTRATVERTFAWGSTDPSTVTVVEPVVVEVTADASADAGVLRHAARLHRARPDLDVDELG